MNTIVLVYFDAGGGHRCTVNTLCQVLEKKYFLQPKLLNVQSNEIEESEMLSSMDLFYKMTGIRGIDIYNNLILKKGWTFLDRLYLTLSKLNIRHKHSAGVSFLEGYWHEVQPDLVVSCIPLFNRILWESLQKVMPKTPFVTLLTDLADCPPNYWMEPQKQFFICPTERAAKQARSFGHPEERIFQTSGLVIDPQFYQPVTVSRRSERQRLGLDPDLPTGLVMFGGYGSTVMIDILKYLERSRLKLQLILLCGNNEELASILCLTEHGLPTLVETFTNEIPYYMHLSDFFIGKPGNISISEAVAMKLPVITECNGSTLVQERYTCEWITNNKIGILIRNFRHIDKAVAELIQPENLARYRANTAYISNKNKAVFEVGRIVQSFLK